MIADIPNTREATTRFAWRKSNGWCSDDWNVTRKLLVEGDGIGYANANIRRLEFGPLRGIIFHGFASSPDAPYNADGSKVKGISLWGKRAIASDDTGNWGRTYRMLG